MHSREHYRVAYRVDDDVRVVTVVWAGRRSRIYDELERRQQARARDGPSPGTRGPETAWTVRHRGR